MNETKFFLFTLVLARVAALTMTAPIFGTNDVPWRVRALLAVALAMLLAPLQWNTNVAVPDNLPQYAVYLGGEALIGICLGLGVLIFVHGMTLAGELVSHVSGMTLAESFDPDLGENVPLFSRLLFLLSIAVFFCLGGHRVVMAGLLDTFQTMPAGHVGAGGFVSIGDAFVTLVSQCFSLGIRAVAPVITASLLATIILGLVSRTIPQFNILSMGLGLNVLLMFAAMGLSLGVAVWAFQDQIEPAMEVLLNALQTPLRTHWIL
jgi:flagellar biosynthetic protein FliR